MKKLVILLFLVCFTALQRTGAQCIADIYYLADSPDPCNFVGSVAMENTDCVDFFNPFWQYTWKISNAENDELMAIYEGWAFSHVFKRFGGYTFCLEIRKDPLNNSVPDIIECITYTTCQPCGESKIEFEFIECPVGEGCNVEFTSRIDALNTVGVKSAATYILTYNPTTPEVNAGAFANDIVYPDIAVEFYPATSELNASEDLHSQFQRGCYDVSLLLELEEGAGAHAVPGGPACTEILLTSDQVFRCIACDDTENGCAASIYSSARSNEYGTCDPFGCPYFRSTEGDTEVLAAPPPSSLASPNPATEVVHLNLAAFEKDQLNLLVLDAVGKLIETVQLSGKKEYLLNVSNLHQGMFMLALREGNKVIHTERILVIR